MRVVSPIDLEVTVAAGVRLGQMRAQFADLIDTVVQKVQDTTVERDGAAQVATGGDLDDLLEALRHLIQASDGFLSVHDLIASSAALRRRSQAMVPEVEAALADMAALAGAGLPEAWLPADARDGFAAAAASGIDAEASARSLLSISSAGLSAEAADALLANWTLTRLWALHGVVLASIAAAGPAAGSASLDTIRSLRSSVESKVLGLRDAVHAVAGDVRKAQKVNPAITARLWVLIDAFETWLLDEGASALADAASGASARVASGSQDAERAARDAALAYDGVRTLLALDAGVRTVLRAYATEATGALAGFAAAGTLAKAGATLDLPRSSLAQAAASPAGTVVEIAGVVRDTAFVVGGPAPRSVLTLGSPNGTQIKVLVPFMAVDSFGVVSGVWIQARGEIFPDGKDDLTGPVLQVRRIRREVAAQNSFLDHLIWIGRDLFEYRPGGVDLVAGRQAGDFTAVAELGLRR